MKSKAVDEALLQELTGRLDNREQLPKEEPAPKPERPSEEPVRRRRSQLPPYEETFLRPKTVERRVAVYVSEQLRNEIIRLVQVVGASKKVSAAGYIENVIRNHLEIYRDDIDCLIREELKSQNE